MSSKFFNYFLLSVLLSCSNNKEKESTYIPVENWPKIPSNYELGNPTGLALKSNQNLIVFHRGSRSWQTPMPKDKIKENTIIEIDKSAILLNQENVISDLNEIKKRKSNIGKSVTIKWKVALKNNHEEEANL